MSLLGIQEIEAEMGKYIRQVYDKGEKDNQALKLAISNSNNRLLALETEIASLKQQQEASKKSQIEWYKKNQILLEKDKAK